MVTCHNIKFFRIYTLKSRVQHVQHVQSETGQAGCIELAQNSALVHDLFNIHDTASVLKRGVHTGTCTLSCIVMEKLRDW